MPDILKGNAKVMDKLSLLCNGQEFIRHTEDCFGNAFHWYTLAEPALVLEAAKIMSEAGARLAIIAAWSRHKDMESLYSASYEFVLEGVVYGATVHMDDEHPEVPSITPIFFNADWHEREMMELYGIKITGHPNPRRLFLDEKLDKGIIDEVVPLSIMMNGASSSDLWEHILSSREES